MQTVGAVGIPARGIAERNSESYGCLQCCGQECPQLLRLAFSYFDPLLAFLCFYMFFRLWARAVHK